jgi:hypothetical protein
MNQFGKLITNNTTRQLDIYNLYFPILNIPGRLPRTLGSRMNLIQGLSLNLLIIFRT